ncbi:MAG TPA: hypothetical protein VGJ90_08100 [Methylophilaceae bacterium]
MPKLALNLIRLMMVISLTHLLLSEALAAENPVISSVLAISKAGGIVRLRGSGFGQDPQVILTSDKGAQKIQPQSAYGGGWLSFKLPPSATGNLSVAVANGGITSNPISVSLGQAPNFTRGYNSSGVRADFSGNGLTASGASRMVSGASISTANAAIQPISPSTASLSAGSQTEASANTSATRGAPAPVLPAPSVNKPANIAMIAPVKPVIFNAPLSAKAGDIVGLQGENFGAVPKVQLVTADGSQEVPVINTYGGVWVSFKVPATVKGFLAAQVVSDVATSDLVKLNAAKPYHLDTTAIAPGGAFRILGRSLLMAGFAPKVLVNGATAFVDVTKSSEHMLVVTAPSIISGGASADISVSNNSGDGFTKLDRNITVLRLPQADPFALGVGWGAGFKAIAENVLDPKNSPNLQYHVSCDGHTNDSDALNESVRYLTSVGGGVIQLPVGVCYLKYSVRLDKNVVIQGAGKDSTVLLYDGNNAVSGLSTAWAGIKDLTLKNAGGATKGPMMTSSQYVFMQNLKIDLGRSEQMWFADNQNFVFKNCDIVLKDSTNLHGPFIFNRSVGLVFEGNVTRFGSGTTTFEGVHDALLYNNTFERDALTQYSNQATIHTIALDFAYRIALINNQLNVVNGSITNKNRNDGEAILTEGGGDKRTENIGVIQSADATSFTDKNNTLNVNPFQQNKIPENYGVAIVAGKGMGQTREIVAYANGKAAIDKAWDSIPDVTSHYATFVWGLEKATIANNKLNGNPRGIWLYQTAMREVDVVGNQINQGGGVYLRSAQKVPDKLFTPIFGVRVADNKISNQTKVWGSYLNNFFMQMDPSDFGIGTIGIEIRNNVITANSPNIDNPGEDASRGEGLMSVGKLETKPYTPLSLQTRILGTIVQGNQCLNCPAPDYQTASQGTVFSQ